MKCQECNEVVVREKRKERGETVGTPALCAKSEGAGKIVASEQPDPPLKHCQQGNPDVLPHIPLQPRMPKHPVIPLIAAVFQA